MGVAAWAAGANLLAWIALVTWVLAPLVLT